MVFGHDRGSSVALNYALGATDHAGRKAPTVEHLVMTNGNIFLPLSNLTGFQRRVLDASTAPEVLDVLTPEMLAAGMGSTTFSPPRPPGHPDVEALLANQSPERRGGPHPRRCLIVAEGVRTGLGPRGFAGAVVTLRRRERAGFAIRRPTVATQSPLWYEPGSVSDVPEGGVPGRASERSVHDFDEMYLDTPPWDIGRPQPVFIRLADEGEIQGRVLDAGCGTGEHVLMLAARGLDVTGVDAAPRAIEAARAKSRQRGVAARFLVWDALRLADLGEQFDTVIDSGLFHVFDDERRESYVEALRATVRPGGRYLLCCFSDLQPGDWGPRRVSQSEIRQAFTRGWGVHSISAAEFVTNFNPPTAAAWLAKMTREGE